MAQNKIAPPSKQEQEGDASLIVQSLIRGILARAEIQKMRYNEMIFLGIDRANQPVKKKDSIWDDYDDPLAFMQQTKETRRQERVEVAHLFEKERLKLEEEILQVEKDDIWEAEYRKRQDWV